MRIVLLRPPRLLWPFNSDSSAFWQPLGLLCLAAWTRRRKPDWRLEVWDCPAEKCGWKSLEARIAKESIDVLGLGEEAVSAHEAMRAAALVKRLWPKCLVVTGGVYFSHAVHQALASLVIDAVVHGEGEEGFVELLEAAQEPEKWKNIAGLSFPSASGAIVTTRPRPLIENLDDLPFPAYELLDMPGYGRASRNHPGLVSLEHSRGCVDSCCFCVLWKHMGSPEAAGGKTRPCWRTKSPGKSFEEVARLFKDFGRRTFGWVDPTFNASAEWSDRFAELMLGSGFAMKGKEAATVHTAWLRADFVVRDEGLGVLEKLVRAGLRQVMMGVERTDADGLAALGKHDNDPEICRRAFGIFRAKYPEVYTIGTAIYGLPGDGKTEIKALAKAQYDMGMDYLFLIPLTPNPGTEFETVSPAASTEKLRKFNFHTPVLSTRSLSPRQLEAAYWGAMLVFGFRWLFHTLIRTIFERDQRRRRVHFSLMRHGARTAAAIIAHRLFGKRDEVPGNKGESTPALCSRKPEWYDE